MPSQLMMVPIILRKGHFKKSDLEKLGNVTESQEKWVLEYTAVVHTDSSIFATLKLFSSQNNGIFACGRPSNTGKLYLLSVQLLGKLTYQLEPPFSQKREREFTLSH